MIWIKTCPRCTTGDLYLDEDSSRHCMQCGHIQHSDRGKPGSAILGGLPLTADAEHKFGVIQSLGLAATGSV